MANEQVVPNTESYGIAVLAVAWEIVKQSHVNVYAASPDDHLRDFTNAVIKAAKAIQSGVPIEKQS